MLRKYSKFIVVFILCVSSNVNAQDSISLYQNIENQLDQFRILNSAYYNNPANMQDYSNTTFSNISLNYQKLNKEAYLLQEGSAHNQFKIQTNSYKVQSKTLTLWGDASYTNTQTKNVQWNNNIDLHRINPVVIADSIGGSMHLQAYNFKGGFAKKLNKFTFGTQLAYQAGLNFKTQDPRPKNVTSDLNLVLGTTYDLSNKYKIGVAAGVNRYIQTSSIKFSSEVLRNALYQMNGLGTYNFYFSNKSQSATYTDFTHHYTFTLGSTNNLFNLTAGTLFGNLSKDVVLSGNTTYETNRLAMRKNFATITKIVPLTAAFNLGAKIDYNKTTNTGTEIFYTNNTDIVTKLLEKENYSFSTTEYGYNLIFQYKKDNTTIYAQPYYKVLNSLETKYDTASTLDFKYNFTGIKLFYLQNLSIKDVLSISAQAYQRKLISNNSQLVLTQHTGINNWLTSDFNLKQTNFKALQTSVRYDRSLLSGQSIYAIFALDYYQFHNNTTNTQSTLSLGITF